MQQLLHTAESESRDLNTTEASTFDSLKGEVAALDTQIQRAETVAELERRADADPVTEQPFHALEQRVSVLAVLRHLVEPSKYPLAGAEAEYSNEMARRSGRKPEGAFVPFAAIEQRAPVLTTTVPEIVPTVHRADLYIDAFRRALISQRLGVRVLTGLSGNITIPRRGTGTSVGWVAEHSPLPDTSMDFDAVSMTPRHCGAIVELSRQVIMQSSPDIENLVREDLARSMAEEVDRVLIDGGAVATEPLGILRTSGTLSASLAGPTWAQVLAMIGIAEDANTPGPLQWLFSPKASRKMRGTLQNANGETYLMQNNQVGEVSALSTAFVPDAGTNLGTAILGDFSQTMLGIWGALDLSTNPYAEAVYRRGGVLVRAISTLDIGHRDPSGYVIADDIPV
ncbi:HK97 family phage major capsid protein [Microvirga lupini]|uniref:HK97 family phage major capsid protein n=1 Tax=Microvirga lupini TaxID=420324 RepID=A0A7W4YX49_9HYPH|nr:phage major capsid protein [Microvirga lupini]MBB3018608.1 HK97 family phage major capsid protein [Microvirga lupini]